ncbi:hypothetical protein JCM10207_000819 [Rhodosporidiobolus poonsookiae]
MPAPPTTKGSGLAQQRANGAGLKYSAAGKTFEANLRDQPQHQVQRRVRQRGPTFKQMDGKKRKAPADGGGEVEGEGDEGMEVEGVEGAEEDDSEDEEGGAGGSKGKNPKKRNDSSTGRKRIAIEYIDDKPRRHVTFTKRKGGLMKKGYELSTLTGTDVLILIVSESGLVYHFSTPALSGIIHHDRGKDLISAALKGELDDPERASAVAAAHAAAASKEATPAPAPSGPGRQNSYGELPIPPSLAGAGAGAVDPALAGMHLPSVIATSVPGSAADGGGFAGYASATELPIPPPQYTNLPSPINFANYPGAATSLAGSESIPSPFLPMPPNSYSPSSSTFTIPRPSAAPAPVPLGLPYPPGHPLHPAPPPSHPQQPSPFDLARQSHAQAFANYQAAAPFSRTGSYVLPDPAAALAPPPPPPPAQGVKRRLSAAAEAEVEGEGGGGEGWERRVRERREGVEAGPEGIEGRKEGWAEKAREALDEAKKLRTLPLSLRAHAYSLLASLPLPPPLPSSTTPTERAYALLPDTDTNDATLAYAALERMCARAGVDGDVEGEMDGVVGEYFGRWVAKELAPLPAPFRAAAMSAHKPYMVALFDFLEAHGLISAQTSARLARFEKEKEVEGLGGERRARLYGSLQGEGGEGGMKQEGEGEGAAAGEGETEAEGAEA